MKRVIKFEYGFESLNGIVKKKYYLHEIPNIKEKCDVWNVLPIVYIRQFTGVKDKNGKEIYHGDKYTMGDINIKYEVVWHDSGFIGKQIGNSSYAGLEHWKDKIELL